MWSNKIEATLECAPCEVPRTFPLNGISALAPLQHFEGLVTELLDDDTWCLPSRLAPYHGLHQRPDLRLLCEQARVIRPAPRPRVVGGPLHEKAEEPEQVHERLRVEPRRRGLLPRVELARALEALHERGHEARVELRERVRHDLRAKK